VEQSVEKELGGEIKVKVQEENLPLYHTAQQKSHITSPQIEPGSPRWEADN
jgi:hypothetical protein